MCNHNLVTTFRLQHRQLEPRALCRYPAAGRRPRRAFVRCVALVQKMPHVQHQQSTGCSRHAVAVRAAERPDAEIDQRRFSTELAVDRYIRTGQTVGLGSGPLTALATAYLAKQLERGSLQDVAVVPGSDTAASEAAFHEVPVCDLQQTAQVDITLTDVDQIDEQELAAIFGVESQPQQPQLQRMKALADKSHRLIALVDGADKVVNRLQGNVPVLVSGAIWEDTAERLDDLLLGDAEVWRRSNVPTSQPRALDDPYVTAAGDNILDLKFRKPLTDPQEDTPLMYMGERVPYNELADHIQGVQGVIAHGLLLDVVSEAVVVTETGPQTLRLQADASA